MAERLGSMCETVWDNVRVLHTEWEFSKPLDLLSEDNSFNKKTLHFNVLQGIASKSVAQSSRY